MITNPGCHPVLPLPKRDRVPHRRSGAAIALVALGAAVLALAGGCEVTKAMIDPVNIGPFFEVKNSTGVARLPATLRRVVLLPVAGTPDVPVDTLASFDPVMLAELQRKSRFEVVVADPSALERLCDHQRLLSSDTLPAQFLAVMSREYGADGVMFIDVTAVSTYQPLVLGLRAKLAATDGTILWAFDTLFTASEPAVANAARRYDRQRHASSDPGDTSYTVLRSPARFADYAAAAAFATLPPR
jgi:hypothetical protein